MSDISNLSDTIIPKSDQLNSDQLLGGAISILITDVKRGSEDQPVWVHYEGDNGRPYKPCKSMRKVLIAAWGDDGHEWIGRGMTIYNDPEVKFGGIKVGGIRISHLSHIKHDMALSLTATRGKKEQYLIKQMGELTPDAWLQPHIEAIKAAGDMASLKKAFDKAQAEAKKYHSKAAMDKITAEKDERKRALQPPTIMAATEMLANREAYVIPGIDPETGEIKTTTEGEVI